MWKIDFKKILKFAKYLIILLLLVFYVTNFDSFVGPALTFISEQGQGAGGGGLQQIGLGFATSVAITRPYLFGLVRLPVYAGDLGDISGIHDVFFAILGLLTAGFLVWDLRFLLKTKTSYTYGSKYQWRR